MTKQVMKLIFLNNSYKSIEINQLSNINHFIQSFEKNYLFAEISEIIVHLTEIQDSLRLRKAN